MSEQSVSKVKLPPVEQIGIVVKDVDKAVEYCSSIFGWGPFQVREVEMEGFTYRGQTGKCRLKMAFSRSGPIEIELIEVLEGETPHTDFLGQKGEGLHHLRFRVSDFDGMVATLAGEGICPVFHQKFADIASFAYLDTDRIGGVIFELFQLNQFGKDEK
jgi:methylmalonyl-CoA/ethylmalonyl-CoA epimerase